LGSWASTTKPSPHLWLFRFGKAVREQGFMIDFLCGIAAHSGAARTISSYLRNFLPSSSSLMRGLDKLPDYVEPDLDLYETLRREFHGFMLPQLLHLSPRRLAVSLHLNIEDDLPVGKCWPREAASILDREQIIIAASLIIGSELEKVAKPWRDRDISDSRIFEGVIEDKRRSNPKNAGKTNVHKRNLPPEMPEIPDLDDNAGCAAFKRGRAHPERPRPRASRQSIHSLPAFVELADNGRDGGHQSAASPLCA